MAAEHHRGARPACTAGRPARGTRAWPRTAWRAHPCRSACRSGRACPDGFVHRAEALADLGARAAADAAELGRGAALLERGAEHPLTTSWRTASGAAAAPTAPAARAAPAATASATAAARAAAAGCSRSGPHLGVVARRFRSTRRSSSLQRRCPGSMLEPRRRVRVDAREAGSPPSPASRHTTASPRPRRVRLAWRADDPAAAVGVVRHGRGALLRLPCTPLRSWILSAPQMHDNIAHGGALWLRAAADRAGAISRGAQPLARLARKAAPSYSDQVKGVDLLTSSPLPTSSRPRSSLPEMPSSSTATATRVLLH